MLESSVATTRETCTNLTHLLRETSRLTSASTSQPSEPASKALELGRYAFSLK